MHDLRLILLLIGVAIVLAVYGWTRYQQSDTRRRLTRTPHTGPGPAADEEPDAEEIERELARMAQLVADREEQPQQEAGDSEQPQQLVDSEQLLIISVVAEPGAPFGAEPLHKALEHNKLQFDEQGIYQRLTVQNGKPRAVFGVANLVKPGTFPEPGTSAFTVPGLTLFLQLPGPIDGLDAFDDFVNTAERLAVELGGKLRDQHHNVLTHQALMQIREGIVETRVHRRVTS